MNNHHKYDRFIAVSENSIQEYFFLIQNYASFVCNRKVYMKRVLKQMNKRDFVVVVKRLRFFDIIH